MTRGGLLKRKTDANGSVFDYGYDRNDRLVVVTVGNQTTAIGYEPGSDNRQWVSVASLDDRGQSVATVEALFQYDDSGRPSARTDFVDGKAFTSAYEYDRADNRIAIIYPTLGAATNRRQISYQPDGAGRTISVTDRLAAHAYATGISYHSSGGVAGYTAGNGLPTTITYDVERYWVRSIASGGVQLGYQQYDDVGNLRQLTDSRPGRDQVLTYDGLDRLTGATGRYGVIQYAYDAHGNRQTTDVTSYEYDPATLRMTAQAGVPFTYDNNGNVRTRGGDVYRYTRENWLSTATVDGATSSYAYDADGLRIKKVSGAEVTYFLRGPDGELLTEWTNPGANGVVRDYVYLGTRLIAAVKRATALDSGDVVGTVTPGGADVQASTSSSGQGIRLMFNGVEGQSISAVVRSVSAFSCNWVLSLLGPDQSTVATLTPCADTTATLGPVALGTTGSYLLVATPVGTTVGSLSMAIHNATVGAPSIAGFSPAIGASGSSIVVTGSNLAPVSGGRVNGTPVQIASASATAVSLVVPAQVASGRLQIQTPSGLATSADDFYVPPPPYSPSQVASTGRVTFGTPRQVTLATPYTVGLLLFDRAAGQRFSVNLTQRTFQRFAVKIYRPDGLLLTDYGAIYPSGVAFIDTKTAPVAGTYTLLVVPAENYTGSATVTVYDVPASTTASLVANGPSVPLALSVPGQNAQLTFMGRSGQRVAAAFTGVTIPYTYVTMRAPDGSVVCVGNIINKNACDTRTLPVDGLYTLSLNPWDNYTGLATQTLYDVPPDPVVAVVPDDTATTVSTPAPWQNASVTFEGAAGQRVTMRFSNGTYGDYVHGRLLAPNGAVVQGTFIANYTPWVDAVTLPAAGTYRLTLDPQWTATGALTVRLNTVVDSTQAITIGGPAVTFTAVAAGQNGYMTFYGEALQQVSVTYTGTFSSCNVYASILKPDGTVLKSGACAGGNGFTDKTVLPVSGTYTLKLDPQNANVGTISATVHAVPADATAVLQIGDPATTVSTTVPGQNAALTFSATAGQQVTVRASSNTIGSVAVRLLRPNGVQQTTTTSSLAAFNVPTQTLPATGTYTVAIDPTGALTGAIAVAATTP